MTAQKVIFLGTNEIARHALNVCLNNPLQIKLCGVITQEPKIAGRGQKAKLYSPVAGLALEKSVPLLMPSDLKDLKFLSTVKAWNAKWAIVLAYGKILPREFLNLFPQRVVNFHASILPRWRGAAPVQRAIMADDKQIGMTLQIVKPRLDTGAIIKVKTFTLTDDMDSVTVFARLKLLVQSMLTKDLLSFMHKPWEGALQNESQATYAHKIQKKECLIMWSKPARVIFNQIRALAIGPQAYTFYKKKRIKIYKAKLAEENNTSHFQPGQVVSVNQDYFTIMCGNGLLNILQLQPESKKCMQAGAYLRGTQLKKGDYFGNTHGCT